MFAFRMPKVQHFDFDLLPNVTLLKVLRVVFMRDVSLFSMRFPDHRAIGQNGLALDDGLGDAAALSADHEGSGLPIVVLGVAANEHCRATPLGQRPALSAFSDDPCASSFGLDTARLRIADPEARARPGPEASPELHSVSPHASDRHRSKREPAAQQRCDCLAENGDADLALQLSEQRFRLIAENTNDVVILSDLDKTRRYVSPAIKDVLGYSAESWIGTKPSETVHPEDVDQLNEQLGQVAEGLLDHVYACVRYKHRDGRWVWVEVSCRLVRDVADRRPLSLVSTLRDVSERREAEERMRRMAMEDDLTGLPNRVTFKDQLERAIADAKHEATSFAVMICDIDRFKAFNHTFGYPAGDRILRVVAHRGRAVLRPNDLFARLGGDEFAAILDISGQPDAATKAAESLLASVGQPIDLDGQIVEIGMSIGLVVASGDEASADEMFRRADTALCLAKAGGTNTHHLYDAATHEAYCLRNHLALEMRDALRRGEFRLLYQPVVDLSTDRVVSFEALVRWQHPQRGEISPSEFIPIAEDTGLIVSIGAWALHEACREAERWPASIRVAVNVSAVQLRRDGIEASVRSALASSGLAASRLKLEITESVLLGDAEPVLACLYRMKAQGVRFALDDFGTGYSSLSYLRRFPFDRIKIDRAFIREIENADTAAIVRAVVAIGNQLGITITAEGVETYDQLVRVRREGCREVQGYFFSPPLPPEEALDFAQRGMMTEAGLTARHSRKRRTGRARVALSSFGQSASNQF